MKPIQFGNVSIPFPVILAPMAGYTDAAFRSICKDQGAGACYTEVTSAEGIRRDSQKTFQLLKVSETDHPIAGHMFGKSVEALVEAAQYIERLGCFDWIDINCGCPVKKVVRRGAGAALMKDPEEIGEIVRAVKKAVSLPVTVKTRIGFSPDFPDHLTIAKIVEDAGADMIAVHGRLACHFHSGDAAWDKLGEIKQALQIPVIGNGGVFTPEDAVEMIRVSGVDGVMIGRGAVGNPWLFKQIASALRDEPVVAPTLQDRRDVIETHLTRLVELTEGTAEHRRKGVFIPEQAACLHFRPHLALYLKGLRGRREVMKQLNEMHDIETVMTAVDTVLEQNGNMECAGLPALSIAELAPLDPASSAIEESLDEQSGGKPPQSNVMPAGKSLEFRNIRWHHRPSHVFEPNQHYMITASTLHKSCLFKDDERLALLQKYLFDCCEKFGWELQAWALMANHYHFIAKSPVDSENLTSLIRQVHSYTARELNRMDGVSGRKVWFQYWDTCLTYEKSYYARLNYVMNNPVHHGLVSQASAYRFCSAGWFEANTDREFLNKVKSFKFNEVKVPDEF